MKKEGLVLVLFCTAILFLCAVIMPIDIANAEEYEVSFEMSSTCVIGTDLVIEGTSTGGDTVDITIDDRMVAVDVPIAEYGKFVKKIPTGAGTILHLPGAYIIKAYVNGPKDRDGNTVKVKVGADVPKGLGILDDGGTAVMMTVPTLSAEQSTDFVGQGNTYSITGSAPGSDYVDLVIIGSKGSYGVGIDGSYGITVYRTSVSKTDYTFSKTITVDKNAEDGRYIAVVLSPGMDRSYGWDQDLSIANLVTSGIFDLKTQAEAFDLLESKTTDLAGSDDLAQQFSFIVGEETGEFVPPETSLTAEQLSDEVAKGDAYRISGTCYGSDFVHIMIISPKGTGGVGIDGAEPGFVIYKLSVENDRFSKRIPVDEGADSGRYIVMIVSPGRNGVYDGIGADDLKKGLNEKYNIERHEDPPTQYQILEIIADATTEAAGSDDLAQELKVKIMCPYITLDSIDDVQIGDVLEITGKTNREDRTSIIVKLWGPTELPPQIVKVTNGTFNAKFDTGSAAIGTYTIQVDDGEGHTDESNVNIVAVVPTTTITSTPKPILTKKPTIAPATTPTESPLKISFTVPSSIEPDTRFTIKAKLRNPYAIEDGVIPKVKGQYVLLTDSDLADIKIKTDDIEIDKVKSELIYAKGPDVKEPEIPFLEEFSAIMTRDPFGYVVSRLVNVPQSPPNIAARIGTKYIAGVRKQCLDNFAAVTCKNEDSGIPLAPGMDLIIELSAKAPSKECMDEIKVIIPYKYTEKEIWATIDWASTPYKWQNLELMEGTASGTERINVEKKSPIPSPAGFEAILAIAGLLAVAHILRRNRR